MKGAYTGTNNFVYMTKSLTITSVEGPDNTIMSGQNGQSPEYERFIDIRGVNLTITKISFYMVDILNKVTELI